MSDERLEMSVKDMEKVIPMGANFVKDARDLNVFKRAYSMAISVHRASLLFPKTEQYALADQLRRASKSICANIAEGFGKQNYSTAEFGRFLGMAEGSVTETQIWLQFSLDLGYITRETFSSWDDDCTAIKSMLHKLRKTL